MNDSDKQNETESNNSEILTATETGTTQLAKYKSVKSKSFVKKNVGVEPNDFKSLSHEQLVVEATRLQRHVTQLKNLLEKSYLNNSKNSNEASSNKKQYKERPFNFENYNKRHVFLKFAYLGWSYQGYTIQEGVDKTVENHIFQALKRTKLIESRETSNYHRCGRTDRGVSAFSQVISIDFRSNCASGIGVVVNPNSKIVNNEIEKEINYVKLLNGALPDEIRAISWSPIKPELSARFDCIQRIYRYYFPKGDLDIDLMQEAGKRLVGEHDFRNFCKMDVGNGVVTFFRRIYNVQIIVLDKEPNAYSTVELIIEGSSFLWHQIRCIAAVLFLVGQKKEEPSIINDLLNIEKFPCKPQYTMCSEAPLVLFDCQYENADWIYDHAELEKVIKHFQDLWLNHQTHATIVKRMVDHLEINLSNIKDEEKNSNENLNVGSNKRSLIQPYATLQGKSQSFNYTKFKDRRQAKSFESRVDYYVKRRRLDEQVYEKIAENNSLAKSLNLYESNTEDNNKRQKVENNEDKSQKN